MIVRCDTNGRMEKIHSQRIDKETHGHKTLYIYGGEFAISHDHSGVAISTLLGSCIAMIFYDHDKHIKGMNHFLLPYSNRVESNKFGLYSIESMINEMYKMGCNKDSMSVKIAGGANVLGNLKNNIGEKNIEFARAFCRSEGFKIVSESVHGFHGRVVLAADGFKTFIRPVQNRTLDEKIKSDDEKLIKKYEKPQEKDICDVVLF